MPPHSIDDIRRERLVRFLAGVTFLIFSQAYMVAPMIPHLSAAFGVPVQRIGLLVPAYLIPYGVSTLFYGLLSARLGLYFSRRYGLGEVGIGLALPGYGVPGFVLGPLLGEPLNGRSFTKNAEVPAAPAANKNGRRGNNNWTPG